MLKLFKLVEEGKEANPKQFGAIVNHIDLHQIQDILLSPTFSIHPSINQSINKTE
jgi:hypothetical protein